MGNRVDNRLEVPAVDRDFQAHCISLPVVAIDRTLKGLTQGRGAIPIDKGVINDAAQACSLVPRLRVGSKTLRPPAQDAAAAALSTVARDAIDLFSSRLLPASASARGRVGP